MPAFRIPLDDSAAMHFARRAAGSGRSQEQEAAAFLALVMRFDLAKTEAKLGIAAADLGAAVKDRLGQIEGTHYIRWDRDYVH